MVNIFNLRRINKNPSDGENGKWICQYFGADKACASGPDGQGICQSKQCKPTHTSKTKRDIFTLKVSLIAIVILVIGLTISSSNRFLMPGPLNSAHSSIKKCTGCHASISGGQFGWLRTALRSATPHKETQACLSCHNMSNHALNPHGHDLKNINDMSRHAQSRNAASPAPLAININRTLFPIGTKFKSGIHCATCHKEHKGQGSQLKLMADNRCQSCHQTQFENFQHGHPGFDNFPAKRRTRINFDHNSHFGKHIPKLIAENDPLIKIPKHCSSCHEISADNGQMNIKPFAEICASCHLNQIMGTERATGPKGIAILSLPGLDITSLRKKGANFGEWPENSEADVTPIMKRFLGWNADQRKLLQYIEKLDLLDLENASKQDISMVENFVRQVKGLIHALSTSGVSEVVQKIHPTTDKLGAPAQSEPSWSARLTASLPRDVLTSARRDWLPNLESEIKKYAEKSGEQFKGPKRITIKAPTKRPVTSLPDQQGGGKVRNGILKSRGTVTTNAGEWTINELGELIKGDESPGNANQKPEDQSQQDGPGSAKSETNETGDESASDVEQNNSDTADNSADDESNNDSGDPAPEENEPALKTAENWAEFGGWYRQDYSIYYRPTGHADSFMRAWLDFTGRERKIGGDKLNASIFEQLTAKDAQGQCLKCHSIDAAPDKGVRVQWGPASPADKKGRFTSFSHRPHIGPGDKQDCMTCHKLDASAQSQDTYKGYNARVFAPNFKQIELKQCQSCHNQDMVRNDCQLCHKYHVNGVTTPIMTTRLPDK